MRFPRINRKVVLLYLAIMGPGIITATADNDAGGIATYSVVGSSYGYEMLWMLFLITFSLGVVQEMCARMGAVTGKGLSDLIRENFGVRWTTLAMLVLLLANFATTVAEFAGIAAGLELFGVSRYISVPLAALMVWGLIVRGSYRFAEKIFFLFALFQGAYVLAGLVTPQDWGLALRSLAVPSFRLEANFVLLFIATIGTTITPWMQFYLQSSVVDKGITASQYRYERLDVLVGAFITDFVSFFIIITTAATLHKAGIAIETAQDAARALEPLAGAYSQQLFAAGLFGASMLAASIVPLSTSYAICEAFGWESGIGKSLDQAPAFYVLYTALIATGAGLVLMPDLSLVRVMLISQSINGLLLPVVLIFMLLLVNNQRIMGKHVNGPAYNLIAWATTLAIIMLTVILVISSAFPGLLR